jgi:GT2 family glycosyltransferase
VSGALLATPRDLFNSLGGLDASYGFGFYEDTDYCFRVRHTGRRVLYQPESVIIHVEGGTVGRDTAVGHKHAQVENQVRFATRWAAELAQLPARPLTQRPEDWYAAAIRSRPVAGVPS